MDQKIDLDLFARLMRLSTALRSDMLEYVGQGAALTEATVGCAEHGKATVLGQKKTTA